MLRRRPRFTFGNWVGGDRDGHPLVSAEITRETLNKLRSAAFEIVDRNLSTLGQRLTLSELFQSPPALLRDALAQAKAKLSPETRSRLSEYPREPWREFVEVMRGHCKEGNADSRSDYARPEALFTWREAERSRRGRLGAAQVAQRQ